MHCASAWAKSPTMRERAGHFAAGDFAHPTAPSFRTPNGMRDRDIAWQRRRERKYREVGFANQRVGEQFVILPALHLSGPEGLQVLGDELGVEQLEAASAKPRHQMHQRDF